MLEGLLRKDSVTFWDTQVEKHIEGMTEEKYWREISDEGGRSVGSLNVEFLNALRARHANRDFNPENSWDGFDVGILDSLGWLKLYAQMRRGKIAKDTVFTYNGERLPIGNMVYGRSAISKTFLPEGLVTIYRAKGNFSIWQPGGDIVLEFAKDVNKALFESYAHQNKYKTRTMKNSLIIQDGGTRIASIRFNMVCVPFLDCREQLKYWKSDKICSEKEPLPVLNYEATKKFYRFYAGLLRSTGGKEMNLLGDSMQRI